MSGSIRVIFKESKFFWRERCTVDIVIIEHRPFGVLELICYESSTDKYAARIYFKESVLAAKLDSDELLEKLRIAKEPFLRRHEAPDEALLQSAVLDSAMVEYILARLSVCEFSSTAFSMEFQLKAYDKKEPDSGGENINLLVCEKPLNLEEHNPQLFHPLKEGEISQALDELVSEQRALQQECANAATLEGKVRRLSLVKERWRVPLVIAKVANGKRLSDSDNKLWLAAMKKVQLEQDAPNDSSSTSAAAAQPPSDVTPTKTIGHGVIAKVKSNRWKDTAAAKKLTPKSQRKNSFSMGVAALRSSLERTLGLSSKKNSGFATASDTTEHMRAAVGSDLDSEPPSVVLSRHASTAADGEQFPRTEVAAARSLMDAVAMHQERLRREHSSTAVTPLPLSRSPSQSVMMIHSIGTVTPKGRRSSRWTGERTPVHKPPSKEEQHAKRILSKLEQGAGAATACNSEGASPSRTASFNEDIAAFHSGDGLDGVPAVAAARSKPAPTAAGHKGYNGVAVSPSSAQDSEESATLAPIDAQPKPSTLRQFFQQISFL